MNPFTAVWKFFTSGSSVIDKGIDILDKKVADVTKRDSLIGEVVLKYLDNPPTIPWVDALHKIMRQAMMTTLAIVYYIEWKNGTPIPLNDFMMIAGGPALYTVMKGTGRK